MVSIFDDDVDEVGSEVEAFCPKCKADTTHVIISKFEDEIRRVQCNPCGDVHAFRKPRGEAEDETPEPIAVKKRAAKVKPTWEQVMAKSSKKTPKVYVVADRYHDNELISHPKFGTGFVSEVIGLDKIEITFQGEKRVLIHNRQGMSLPPAAYAHFVDAKQLEHGTDKRKGAIKKAAEKTDKAGAAKPVAGKKEAPAAKDAKAAPAAKADPKAKGKPEAAKPAEKAKAAPVKKAAPAKPATAKPAAAKAQKKPAAKTATKPAAKKPAPAVKAAKTAAKPKAKPAAPSKAKPAAKKPAPAAKKKK